MKAEDTIFRKYWGAKNENSAGKNKKIKCKYCVRQAMGGGGGDGEFDSSMYRHNKKMSEGGETGPREKI